MLEWRENLGNQNSRMADNEDDDLDMGQDEDINYENLQHEQRLKAAVHYTVGKICEELGEENDLRYSKHFIAALTETAYRQIENFACDLELFAKHGKRTVINSDDVVLLSRKSSSLSEHMKTRSKELTDAHQAERASRKPKKNVNQSKKQKTAVAAVIVEDDEEQ